MADALALALANLKTKPVDTPYGIGALTIAQNIPNMIDPYGNPWSNLAIGAGSVLTSALLGYQAREQAREENLEMQPFITRGLSATTAEELDALLKEPGGERFGDVATQLKLQLLAGKAAATERKQELEADIVKSLATRFGVIPTELQGKIQMPLAGSLTLDQQQALDLSAAQLRQKMEAEEASRVKDSQDWFRGIPAAQKVKFTALKGFSDELKSLADQFRKLDSNAVELQAASLIPGSPADLAFSKMNSLVPNVARMLGEVGNLAQQEQDRLIKATMGSSLSGSNSIAARLDQLDQTAKSITIEQLGAYKTISQGGGEALLENFRGGADSVPSSVDAQIDQLESILSDPTVSEATKATARQKVNELLGQ